MINNLDVWVSNAGSQAVVVKAGMFCTLIGISSPFSNLFQSHGITTGSSIRIMSVDYKNGKTCIHIVDVDGESYYMLVKILLTACNLPNHSICAFGDPIMTCLWLRRVAM